MQTPHKRVMPLKYVIFTIIQNLSQQSALSTTEETLEVWTIKSVVIRVLEIQFTLVQGIFRNS